MFKIEYRIISERFTEIENITNERIQYDFLLGSISFFSLEAVIEIDWEWIPLLDFAYCLRELMNGLKKKYYLNDYFEFTESAETLDFLREGEQLNISTSFSSTRITTTFTEFEKAVNDLHLDISKYIKSNIFQEIPQVLQKFLFDES